MNKAIMNFIIGTVLFYVLFCGVLYIKQRSMIYFPDTSKPQLPQGAELVQVTGDDGQKIESWYIEGKDADKPVIIYYHGNAGNFSHRIHKAIFYLEAGYSVLLAEYRGYGGNDGDISESGIYNDARTQFEWLLENKGYNPHDVIIYGESIGSGPAVQIATEYSAKALILETPFSSLLDVVLGRFFFIPVKHLLKDQYLSADKIQSVTYPVFIIHGDLDSTIPISLAKKLYDAANEPKKFVEIKGGNHNDLYSFHAYKYILGFLSGLEVNNPDNVEK